MSGHTLPILFINLGGEMLYVLTQRLTAQCVAQDKSQKVVCDIVNTMYGMKFMSEITRPQDLFARQNLRLIFEKLVHTSIMRLNSVSMDKLFDLMTMAVKYQILFCNKPKDLLLVTYNHLDTIAKLIPDQQVQTKALVENVYKTVDKIFGGMTAGQFQRLRAMLLNFFQDIHVRVSVFLRDKLQTQTGKFIIGPNRTLASGVDTPGSIRIYKRDGSWARTKAFKPGVSCVKLSKEPAYGIYGDRVITLGLNLYADDDGKSRGVSVDNRPQKEVVCDIVNTMYGMKFMSEITRPQDLFARQNLRLIFEKLVHTSIMRLNSVSMDKLFDLMTMAVKYQILFCNKPKDLLLVTYNHLDTIAKLIPDQQVQTKALVENVYKTVDKIFGGMTAGQFQRLRAMLLNFFQDIHVRVSVFLRDKLQTQTGKFIIGPNRTLASGVDTPGSIRIYKRDGSWARTKAFKPAVSCVKLSKEPAYGIYGDRVITLGLNLYADDDGKSRGVSVDNRPQKEDAGSLGVKKTSVPTVTSSELEKMAVDESAAKELDILNSLLGHLSAGNGKGGGNVTFQLDLFGKDSSNSNSNDAPLPSASELSAASSSNQHSAQRIQVKKVNSSKLDSVAAEMTLADDGSKGQSKGDDLLDLFDRA
ncbi:uncharacterized protein LOC142351229 [Convolutriloba macropyga]|uniref:uncharacterized protein LOC142351229 n=1 Tax=Convolutriloba macropyga TaxID=536237 RepID=UPI003F5244ED